jgi:uncharacterized coiled-coil DUF342 family protein
LRTPHPSTRVRPPEKIIRFNPLGFTLHWSYDMAEFERGLLEKRERANADAEKHRRRRDDLNDKTRQWVEKRDQLNAQARPLIEEATIHREKRDALNLEVKKAKEERDRWNRKVSDLTAMIGEIKRRKMPRGEAYLFKLRKELKALEFRQMTSVLTADKEKDLIGEMGRIQAEINSIEQTLEEDADVKKARAELEATKEMAEAAHKKVGEIAEQAQAEHDIMTSLYEQGDAVRREADSAQEEFIKTKMMADEEHRNHIDYIRLVHDYDKILHGVRARAVRPREEVMEIAAKKEAELIYERFRRGEKLSTEDLMTLQKSGYL